MSWNRLVLVLAASFLLAGCLETVSCPEGTGFPPGGDECAPLPDSGLDASVPDASDPPDGSVCGACTIERPLCDVAAETCVACLDDGDCTDDAALFCETGACVQCRGDEHCNDPGAARCADDGTCAGCDDSSQCTGITGTTVCDTGAQTCVECTAAEAGACGGNPCTTMSTCSAYGETAQDACQPCDTDANCMADHYCVPMRYMGSDRPGGYCLKTTTGGCMRPFSITISDRATLSGQSGLSFCGINETLATCDAVRALLDDMTCPLGTECPEGSLCRMVGTLVPNRCSYRCGNPEQCIDPADSPARSTCGDGTPPSGTDYCGG